MVEYIVCKKVQTVVWFTIKIFFEKQKIAWQTKLTSYFEKFAVQTVLLYRYL